jgi:hypothetical protein
MKLHTPMIEDCPLAKRTRSLIVTLLLASATGGAMAQQSPSPVAAAAAKAAAAREQTSAPSNNGVAEKPSAINSDQALYLVRSAVLTLNDANRSGNYTVLRDLAAPDFQARNTAADLAQIFADLRRRNFDLFAAALLAPKFTAAPALDSNRRMRLTGFFPTRPLQISFDLTFQSAGGQWRLFAISVATPEAPAAQSLVRPPAPETKTSRNSWARRFSANPAALTITKVF